MPDPYRVFGACILLREIFEDDLGHLYRAGMIAGETLDRAVWLRVLDAEGLPNAEIAAALDDARRTAAEMTGSQLPGRPFFLEVGGVAALGHDHVAGQPLNRVLERARDEAFPLQPDNSLLIVEKVALAVTAGDPLVHGFLHPGLIHLSYDGEATLTGFGLGRALLAASGELGVASGARAYLAPEALTGGDPTPAGDVYSLGAILFHLLTGTALPAADDERGAALDAARLAWDGEGFPTDIRSILVRSVAMSPGDRFPSAAEFRAELDRLLYGGTYSPTTFNLALFMDRLFRNEIEDDGVALERERSIDVTAYLEPEPEPPEPEPEPVAALTPETAAPPERRRRKGALWAVIGALVVVGVVAAVLWFGRGIIPHQQPAEPTPTAAEIAAQRQAQEDRLRTLTQEMVQTMMAEREEEIREELVARQQRIEELQRRLQQSERRAAQSASAAADEAETQEALKREIEQQEEAQRAQQDALETERQKSLEDAGETAIIAATGAAAGGQEPAAAEGVPDTAAKASTVVPTASPAPSPTTPPLITEKPSPAPAFGAFVDPDEADTLPVVVKSQALEWPRNAARSKGKGVVVVQLTVNAEGGVDDVEVLRADHEGWGIPEAALDAAAGYRFKPGTKDGVAITTHAYVTWRYDFTEQ